MEKPTFSVRLADLERGPLKVSFAIGPEWLARALAETEAKPAGKPGSLNLELTKNGAEVMVRGRARVSVEVPCVVTLDPLPFELEPEIFLLLRQEAEGPERAKRSAQRGKAAPQGNKTKRGKARLEDPELSEEDAAFDAFRGEEIALDDFVREFIVLEIPPYPRRSDLPSPEEGISSRALAGAPPEEKPIDPRLAPLLGLRSRLRGEANKE